MNRTLIIIALTLGASLTTACPSASANPNHFATLTWKHVIDPSVVFEVYKSTNSITYSQVASVSTLRWTDSNVLPNHTYWYRVTAYYTNTNFETAPSNTVIAIVNP